MPGGPDSPVLGGVEYKHPLLPPTSGGLNAGSFTFNPDSGVLNLASDGATLATVIADTDVGVLDLVADAPVFWADYDFKFTASGILDLAADNAAFWATADFTNLSAALDLAADNPVFWADYDFKFTASGILDLVGDAPAVNPFEFDLSGGGELDLSGGGNPTFWASADFTNLSAEIDLVSDGVSIVNQFPASGEIDLVGDGPTLNPFQFSPSTGAENLAGDQPTLWIIFPDTGVLDLGGDAPTPQPFQFTPSTGAENLAGDQPPFFADYNFRFADGGAYDLAGGDTPTFPTIWDQGTGVEILAADAPLIPGFTNVAVSGVLQLSTDGAELTFVDAPEVGIIEFLADAPPQVMQPQEADSGLMLFETFDPDEIYPVTLDAPARMTLVGRDAVVPPPTGPTPGALLLASDGAGVSFNPTTSGILQLRGVPNDPTIGGFETPASATLWLKGDAPDFHAANFVPTSGKLVLKSDKPVVTPLTLPSGPPTPGGPGNGVAGRLA